jgi:amidase
MTPKETTKMSATFDILTTTAAELQDLLRTSAGGIDSEYVVRQYLAQIKRHEGYLRAVISTAPENVVLKRAHDLDVERATGKIRGPLHGIPVILKDNIATVPALGMDTTAGTLALVQSRPKNNAEIVGRVCLLSGIHSVSAVTVLC